MGWLWATDDSIDDDVKVMLMVDNAQSKPFMRYVHRACHRRGLRSDHFSFRFSFWTFILHFSSCSSQLFSSRFSTAIVFWYTWRIRETRGDYRNSIAMVLTTDWPMCVTNKMRSYAQLAQIYAACPKPKQATSRKSVVTNDNQGDIGHGKLCSCSATPTICGWPLNLLCTQGTVNCSRGRCVSHVSPVKVHGGHNQRQQRNRKIEGVEVKLNTHILRQKVGIFRFEEGYARTNGSLHAPKTWYLYPDYAMLVPWEGKCTDWEAEKQSREFWEAPAQQSSSNASQKPSHHGRLTKKTFRLLEYE